MTVCIATDGYPPMVGGICTFNQHLVSLLVTAGHNVIVIFKDGDNNDEDSIISEGAFTKVILKKTYRNYYKNWQLYFRPGGFDAPNWIGMGMAMREWLLKNQKKYKIDIIEVSDYGGYGIFLCDTLLPPVIITGHGSLLQFVSYNHSIKDDGAKIICRLEEVSFLHADAVITHSLLNKNNLEKLFKKEIDFANIPWQNKTVVSNKPSVPQKLVVIGGLQPIKGIYDMADAMNILFLKDQRIILNWIGGDTWLAPGHQQMSSYLQTKYSSIWQKTFVWRNEQSFETTQQEISEASLIIIPAIFETFNYVALEAAALKKPIIITEKTGASFLFTHGKDAWVVPANNPEAMAIAILYLLDNPDLCSKLGEKAYEILHKVFKPEKLLSERMAIYNSTLQKRDTLTKGLHSSLSFLDRYHTSWRKYYYCIRKTIKKIIRKG